MRQGQRSRHQKHKRLKRLSRRRKRSPRFCARRAGSRRHRAHGANGKPSAFVRKTDGKEAVWKKLLSEAAIRAKTYFSCNRIILQHIVGKGSFQHSERAKTLKQKTTYSLNNKAPREERGKHVSAAGGKVLSFFKRLPALAVKYRLAVSSIMVVIIGAIVIGVALGGKSSKTFFKGDQQALHSVTTRRRSPNPLRTPNRIHR